jgi:divinyl protochlorophyllide a 8-vinyl-reductase
MNAHARPDHARDGGAPVDLVGPNAILQTAEALQVAGGEALARNVFARAGLCHLLDLPPSRMIDARIVRCLNDALVAALPPAHANAILRDAGIRTGRYILENRIPAFARMLLKFLPAPLSMRLLLKAVTAHSWTFAGNAKLVAEPGNPAAIAIIANPLALPGCPWHCAVFETLMRELVSPHCSVAHERKAADGVDRFSISR